jgi:dihydroneopterin aldolase
MTDSSIKIPPRPAYLDSVRLRDIQLPLIAPEAWHREGKTQPCTATLKLSYSSIVGAADSDNVSLTLDYGKLFRQLETNVRTFSNPKEMPDHLACQMISVEGTHQKNMLTAAPGQDPRVTAALVADAGLEMLDQTAKSVKAQESSAVSAKYGECEVELHLPKALLRSEEGLRYRSVTAWGFTDASVRRPVVLEEEYRIEGIRCYAILGVNPHERVEKQAVIVGLTFQGAGQLDWGSKVVETYQAVTRAVAEVCLSSTGAFALANLSRFVES